MAFNKTAGTIIIDALLTDKGRTQLAHGNLKVTKFALGDDEIDYSTFDASKRDDSGYHPELTGSSIFEAYGSRLKNLQYGLFSRDQSAIGSAESDHAQLMHLPVLAINNKVDITPTLRDGVYYISVNEETTQKMDDIFSNSFKFLQSDVIDKSKILVESGLDQIPATADFDDPPADIPLANLDLYFSISPQAREYFIEKKYLLDRDFHVYVDNRFIVGMLGTNSKSVFKNYKNGDSTINFETLERSIPVSIENEFEEYATYLVRGTKNLMFDFNDALSYPSTTYSSLGGPKGTVMAANFVVNGYLKNNSNATRDFRYTQYGTIDQYMFDATHKFDYIDTTIYVMGFSSQSRIQVPLRLIRYSGT
jgi:hypothetical protein